MSEPDGTKHPKEGVNYVVFICVCGLVALVLILAYLFGFSPVKVGNFLDSDCYMHLIRASDLYHFGHWYDPVLIKSNTPYGEGLHWSRPFDVLLLAGAVPLGKLVGFKSALFWWGVAISPILMALSLIALNWATRIILSRDGAFLVVLIFLPQTILLSYLQAARPDHHSLLILLFVLSVGLVLRLIVKPFSMSRCYLAGAVGALAVWVSIEATISVYITIGTLALIWIMEKRDSLRKGLHYSFALFLFTGVCLVLERPLHDLGIVEFDRLSIVYLTIFALAALFWTIASFVQDRMGLLRQPTGRLFFGVLGFMLCALAIGLLFPGFYKGPFAEVDSKIIQIMFDKIAEVQPLLSKSIPFSMSLRLLGPLFIFCCVLCYIRLRGIAVENRNGWLYITISTAAFAFISFFQVRWGVYPETLLSIFMAALLSKTLERYKDQKVTLPLAIKKGLIVMTFAVGFLYAGLLAETLFRADKPEKNKSFSIIQLCNFLNKPQNEWGGNLRMLMNPVFGAEILYRTDHEVMATVNRYGPGVLDTYDIMTADIDEKAYEILTQRGIDVILICPESKESTFYTKPEQASTFYQRLLDNEVPSWLSEIELPEDLSSSFRLFEVLEN